MTNTHTTYTKLKSGAWGLRGMRLVAGSTVTVTKRNGTTKTETVGQIVWTGADGTTLAATATAPAIARSSNYDPQKFNGYGAPRGGYRRACKTDGNCSSFGSGRSCGGHDCDGY